MRVPDPKPATTATNAPRAVAECAASIAALQLDALLSGSREPVDREVRLTAAPWGLLETRLPRDPTCRGLHAPWAVERADPELTLRELLAHCGAGPGAQLRVFGSEWIPTLRCSACREETPVWRTTKSVLAEPRCARCGARLALRSFDLRSAIPLADLPPHVVNRRLREFGWGLRETISVESASATFHYELSTTSTARGADHGIVLIAGLGAVGSAAVPLVAATAGVRCVVLVDLDVYEASNLGHQAISPDAVGQPKVAYQAARLRELRPDLDVVPIDRRLEEAPLGLYRDAVVVGCVDSRVARLELTERASRVARFQIDVGIDGPTRQARVQCFEPGHDRACVLCGWTDVDFDQLELVMPCDAARSAPREEDGEWIRSSSAI